MAVDYRRFVVVVFVTYGFVTLYFIGGRLPAAPDVAKHEYIARGMGAPRAVPKSAERQRFAGLNVPNANVPIKNKRRMKGNVENEYVNAGAFNSRNNRELRRRNESWIIQTLRPYVEQNDRLPVQPNKPLQQRSPRRGVDNSAERQTQNDTRVTFKEGEVRRQQTQVKNALSNNLGLPADIQSLSRTNGTKRDAQAHVTSGPLSNGPKSASSDYSPSQRTINFIPVAKGIYIYSAFYDDRDGRFVRLITIASAESRENPEILCHFVNGTFTRGEFYKTCEDHQQTYAAYVISCPVPNIVETSQLLQQGIALSAAQFRHKATRVQVISTFIHNPESRRFNLCVPPMFGNVDAHKLLEFIEVSKILGAEHFTFYTLSVKPEVQRVLDMYSRKNEATVLPWTLPVKNLSVWNYGQSASAWDCLYRNMNYFKYISYNDIDEYIVTKTHTSWDGMIRTLVKANGYTNEQTNEIAAYRFQSEFFHNGEDQFVPGFSPAVQQLVTLNTIWRTKAISRIRTKVIVDPVKVFEVGIHHLSKPLRRNYVTIEVPPSTAAVQHYRKCDTRYGTICGGQVRDYTVWRYYSAIVKNVQIANAYLKGMN